jgi:hypothetical protein
VGNFTVQNHDDGWVTLTDQHPTAIIILNGKISHIELEQILKLFLATMSSVARHKRAMGRHNFSLLYLEKTPH